MKRKIRIMNIEVCKRQNNIETEKLIRCEIIVYRQYKTRKPKDIKTIYTAFAISDYTEPKDLARAFDEMDRIIKDKERIKH